LFVTNLKYHSTCLIYLGSMVTIFVFFFTQRVMEYKIVLWPHKTHRRTVCSPSVEESKSRAYFFAISLLDVLTLRERLTVFCEGRKPLEIPVQILRSDD
jgi:hypothetical protein